MANSISTHKHLIAESKFIDIINIGDAMKELDVMMLMRQAIMVTMGGPCQLFYSCSNYWWNRGENKLMINTVSTVGIISFILSKSFKKCKF